MSFCILQFGFLTWKMMQVARWSDNERFKFESRTNGQRGGVGKGEEEEEREETQGVRKRKHSGKAGISETGGIN